MDSKKLALLCRELADHKKAEDIIVLDVRKTSSITDYFVIVTGTSEPHLRAISSEILEQLSREHDVAPLGTDGSVAGGWVVMDFFDVIVHIMHRDMRNLYDLETLWGDAPRVKARAKAAARA